jgi:hypothetical protein
MTNDKQRERLVDLIKQGEKAFADKYEGKVMSHIDELYEFITDYLLANGVIVPPCDIGQTVYTRYGYSFKIQRIEILEDKKILFRCGNDGTDDYMAFYDFEIGTDVFLTKEEAEQALQKGR